MEVTERRFAFPTIDKVFSKIQGSVFLNQEQVEGVCRQHRRYSQAEVIHALAMSIMLLIGQDVPVITQCLGNLKGRVGRQIQDSFSKVAKICDEITLLIIEGKSGRESKVYMGVAKQVPASSPQDMGAFLEEHERLAIMSRTYAFHFAQLFPDISKDMLDTCAAIREREIKLAAALFEKAWESQSCVRRNSSLPLLSNAQLLSRSALFTRTDAPSLAGSKAPITWEHVLESWSMLQTGQIRSSVLQFREEHKFHAIGLRGLKRPLFSFSGMGIKHNIPFQSFLIWLTINEIGKELGFHFSREVTERLHAFFLQDEEKRRDSTFYVIFPEKIPEIFEGEYEIVFFNFIRFFKGWNLKEVLGVEAGTTFVDWIFFNRLGVTYVENVSPLTVEELFNLTKKLKALYGERQNKEVFKENAFSLFLALSSVQYPKEVVALLIALQEDILFSTEILIDLIKKKGGMQVFTEERGFVAKCKKGLRAEALPRSHHLARLLLRAGSLGERETTAFLAQVKVSQDKKINYGLFFEVFANHLERPFSLDAFQLIQLCERVANVEPTTNVRLELLSLNPSEPAREMLGNDIAIVSQRMEELKAMGYQFSPLEAIFLLNEMILLQGQESDKVNWLLVQVFHSLGIRFFSSDLVFLLTYSQHKLDPLKEIMQDLMDIREAQNSAFFADERRRSFGLWISNGASGFLDALELFTLNRQQWGGSAKTRMLMQLELVIFPPVSFLTHIFPLSVTGSLPNRMLQYPPYILLRRVLHSPSRDVPYQQVVVNWSLRTLIATGFQEEHFLMGSFFVFGHRGEVSSFKVQIPAAEATELNLARFQKVAKGVNFHAESPLVSSPINNFGELISYYPNLQKELEALPKSFFEPLCQFKLGMHRAFAHLRTEGRGISTELKSFRFESNFLQRAAMKGCITFDRGVTDAALLVPPEFLKQSSRLYSCYSVTREEPVIGSILDQIKGFINGFQDVTSQDVGDFFLVEEEERREKYKVELSVKRAKIEDKDVLFVIVACCSRKESKAHPPSLRLLLEVGVFKEEVFPFSEGEFTARELSEEHIMKLLALLKVEFYRKKMLLPLEKPGSQAQALIMRY